MQPRHSRFPGKNIKAHLPMQKPDQATFHFHCSPGGMGLLTQKDNSGITDVFLKSLKILKLFATNFQMFDLGCYSFQGSFCDRFS